MSELILKQMLKQRDPLSLVFQALADPTRRELVDRLVRGPASVSQLCEPHDMTMSAVVQHLGVLDAAGLVSSQKLGRVRTYQVAPAALRVAESWLTKERTPWERNLDRLAEHLGGPSEPADSTSSTRSTSPDKEPQP